ncbi:MAG TPA: LPS assembly protein LptD [Desulfuromonadales bacterium]|nr:LPS assembly protein LptD [Desulfuromonadales bacterium]
MLRLCFYILCLLTGCLLWAWLPSASADALGEGPVTLEADRLSYEPVGEVYTATGQVLLQQGTFNLKAEELLFETALQDLAATGAVRIRQQEDELHGDRIHYNLTTGQGRLEQGRVFLGDKNFHLSGASVAKTGPDSYRVENGRFTTCDGEIPDWEFTAERVEVTMGRYARVRNAWFRVRELPLFYFPYLVYPVKAERETGLLTPQYGHSRERGTRISLAWYQIIDRNQDATLYLDYLSKKGVGKGLEYRYLFAGDNLGLARYYHVSGIAETPDLYAVEWRHGGMLPGKVRLTADIEYVDDRLLFEDFGEAAEDYNREQTLATVIAQRNWGKFNLAGHLRYLKDLESDNDLTLQRLPELSATASRYRLWRTPLFFSFESFATRFRSDEAAEGERYSLRPSLGMVLNPGSWLTVAPEVAVTYRSYSADATADDSVTVPEFSLALSTQLQKVIAFERWGFDRLRHRIEPEIRYVYTPDVDQEDLPFFDLQDRIAERNRIEYALINRFTARKKRDDAPPVYREILKLRLSQSYLIDEQANLTTPTSEKDAFSALRIELDARPSRRIFLALDGDLAVDEGRTFSRLEIAAGLDDQHGNRFEVGYHYLRQEAVEPDLQADHLRAELETALLKPVYLHLEERYDIGEDRSLETVVGLEYRARCWSLLVAVRDRLDDQSVTVNFQLAGLGGTEGFW